MAGASAYGPPIYLHTVGEARGWPLALVSTAVTTHFLVGTVVIANLPRLYRRFGVATITKAGAITSAAGIIGWAIAQEPWQLLLATLLSGGGWVTMGAAAVNAIIAPWFSRTRPAALASACNGSSDGGIVFSPLWVAAIDLLGFPLAAAAIGLVTIVTVWVLADLFYARTPASMGLQPDGDAPDRPKPAAVAPAASLPGSTLWRDWRFLTLSAAVALGLFAQIGLLAHLFSLLTVPLGAQWAGIAAGSATAAAIIGRTLFGWLMPAGADRRLFACASHLVQIAGSLAFLAAGGESIPLLLTGVVLFGFGIGNVTSLPPLIAQSEFAPADVSRVVPMIIAIAQGCYAFAPSDFGLLRDASTTGSAPYLFAAAAAIQAAAIAAFLAGRRRRPA